MKSRDTRSSHAKLGERPTPTDPASPDPGENSASTIVEAPMGGKKKKGPLDPHDFPDGGGSGGAEAFRRRPLDGVKD